MLSVARTAGGSWNGMTDGGEGALAPVVPAEKDAARGPRCRKVEAGLLAVGEWWHQFVSRPRGGAIGVCLADSLNLFEGHEW